MVDFLRFARRASLFLLLPLLLAGCENFQPYWGKPGGMAPRLASPPAYRLAVLTPPEALLTDAAAGSFAKQIAGDLEAAEIPAVVEPPQPLDWRLIISAEVEGDQVTPRYNLRDADNNSLGIIVSQPLPARDWSLAENETLSRIAARDAPQIVNMLTRIEASRKATDPKALEGRPAPKLRFTGVKGAPGDGDTVISERMRDFLSKAGLTVQDVADGAAYALVGDVKVVQTPNGKDRVEIQWTVTRADGHELGRVLQLNEVERNSLSKYWGDVAYVVAQEASGGVRDVIANAGGLPKTAP